MDNNEHKKFYKKIISFVLICIALGLYQINNIINKIILMVIFLALMIMWIGNYITLISNSIKIIK